MQSWMVVQEQTDGKDFCSIDYGFEARLHRPGNVYFDAKVTSEIKILSRPQETAAAVPVLAGPETQSLSYWCCFNRGRSVTAMAVFSVVYLVINTNTAHASRHVTLETERCRSSRVSVGLWAHSKYRQRRDSCSRWQGGCRATLP